MKKEGSSPPPSPLSPASSTTNADSNPHWHWWHDTLKAPCFILAPMVAQGDLAFRTLVRRYNTHLCYSPMLLAESYVKSKKYGGVEGGGEDRDCGWVEGMVLHV